MLLARDVLVDIAGSCSLFHVKVFAHANREFIDLVLWRLDSAGVIAVGGWEV